MSAKSFSLSDTLAFTCCKVLQKQIAYVKCSLKKANILLKLMFLFQFACFSLNPQDFFLNSSQLNSDAIVNKLQCRKFFC